MSEMLESGVYFTKDIMRLFECGVNEVPRLVQEGTIPRPLPNKDRGRKRWSRAAVNRKLGISPSHTDESDVRRMIAQEMARLLTGGTQ